MPSIDGDFLNKSKGRLPADLEEVFKSARFQRYQKQVRLGIAFGTFLYALFGLLDIWIIPDAVRQAWIIRYAVMLPIASCVFLFTFSRHFSRFMQAALFLFTLSAGMGIIAMTAFSNLPGGTWYYAGLILVIMYAHGFSGLNFTSASILSWTIIVLYNAVTLLKSSHGFGALVSNNFFLISACLLGMLSSYQNERSLRRDFIQGRIVFEKERLDREIEKATRSLRESEAKFRTLAETVSAGIFIHQGGRLLYVNPAGERLTGYTPADLLTHEDFWNIVHPDYRELVQRRAQARLQGIQIPSQYEFKIVKKDGAERWVYMGAGLIEYGGMPAIIGTLFDVTDLKRAEEEKARLARENLQNCRLILEKEKRHLQEKEKIIRDLHDGLGSIITNIGFLAELAKNGNSTVQIHKALMTISDLAKDGLSEIRLFMQSLDAAETTWQALAATLRHQGMALIEPHGVSFKMAVSLDGSDGSPGSLAYLNLHRIYKEALTNVVKHAAAKSVYVTLVVVPGRAVLEIMDDGTGMGSGTGRGMSSMKKRAEELGGRLTVTSGQGTRISVELPIPQKYPAEAIENYERNM